jgi:uncharacterized membrane protein
VARLFPPGFTPRWKRARHPTRSEAIRVAEAGKGAIRKARKSLPVDKLGVSATKLLQGLTTRTLRMVGTQAGNLADRVTDQLGEGAKSTREKAAAAGAEELAGGKSPIKAGLSAGMAGVKDTVKNVADTAGRVVGAGGDGQGGPNVVNILEEFDVALPVRVAYDQWTRFEDFPGFTKKVESVEQESEEKLNWRAQIFFSHRTWESTIVDQVPDERIVWRSKGPKGFADGAVTFHELAPNLTRVLLVVEYHPDGFFEKTANLWKAQGRRLRLEFKNIQRHMMTQTLLRPQEVEGWRGEIHDGEVVKSHEDAIKEERQKADQAGQPEGAEGARDRQTAER